MSIGNPVAQNRYRGAILTDEGYWSPRKTRILDKDHGICSKHKSNGIFASKAGLGVFIGHCIKDMYVLIYDVFSYEEEYYAKIDAALEKYVHNSNANKYIETIRNTRGKLCATYMQFVLSYIHTTTHVGKGFNDCLKDHGDLKKYLSVLNFLMLHSLVD